MAISFKRGDGKTTTGDTITANAAGSTTTLYLKGPARDLTAYKGAVAGRYVLEAAGASGAYRWVEDYPLPAGTASPAGFTADNI